MEISKKKVLIAVGIGTFVGIFLVSGIAIAKFSFHGKFPSGTSVFNIDLSHKTPQESKEILAAHADSYLKTPLKIEIRGEKKEFSPQDLGVNILVDETIATLKPIDARNFGLLNVLTESGLASQSREPVVTVNYETLKSTLGNGFSLEEIAPVSGNFFFDDKQNLAIREGKSGVLPDTLKLSGDLKLAAKEFDSGMIAVDLVDSPPAVTAEMLENQRADIESALGHPLTLIDPVYSDDWHIKLQDHLDWVKFAQKRRLELPYFSGVETVETVETTETVEDPVEGGDGEYFVAIEIDGDALNKFVDEKISKWLDRPAENVEISRDDSGKVIITGKGSNGKQIQRRLLKEAIELAVEKRVSDVTIPVLDLEPEIEISQDLQDLGIKERIAVGHTSYYGSPGNRVHNIKVGAARFNGALVAPDEVFSFNKTLGAVDGSTGYKKELVIKKEGTIPEYGGGICQVSTTMFRSVLFGGLPIVERNQHSYAVSYYSQILGHGLDATIYLGGADLKFKNDTGRHILIQTYTENDYELYIVFYGTQDGRSVEMEGPYISNNHKPGPTIYEENFDLPEGQTKQVEKSHTGFNALWYRILTRPDGTQEKESISTHYQAVRAKILVGKKTPEL